MASASTVAAREHTPGCVGSRGDCGPLLFLKKLEHRLDKEAQEQALFLDNISPRFADLAIVLTAAISLFLELEITRWQSSVLVFLAFYKNFTLIACFGGLGLGYSLASRTRIPLLSVIPMMVMQIGFIMILQLVSRSCSRQSVPGWRWGTVPETRRARSRSTLVLTVIFLGHSYDLPADRPPVRPDAGTPRQIARIC